MKDITLKQYLELKDVSQYSFIDSLKPKDTFNGVKLDISLMTYSEVKGVMKSLKDFKTIENVKDIFETCFKCDVIEFYNSNLVAFTQAKKHVLNTFKKLIENENKLLQSVSVDAMLWQSAGGDKLNKFSDIMALVQLGEIYGVYPFELENKKYFEILTLLRVNKVKNEVDAKYNELKRQQK